MAKNLLLHAGFPKSATTSFQKVCFEHMEHLKAVDHLYPTAALSPPEKGHHNLPRSFDLPGSNYRLFNPTYGSFPEVATEWHESGCRNLVLSSEGFHFLFQHHPDETLRILTRYFSHCNVRIYFTVRPYDDFLESIYLQSLKEWMIGRRHVNIPTFTEHVNRRGKRQNVAKYLAPIKHLQDRGLDVEIVLYDAHVVTNLLSAMELDVPISGGEDTVNVRMSLKLASVLEFLSNSDSHERLQARIATNGYKNLWSLLGTYNDATHYRLLPHPVAEMLRKETNRALSEMGFQTFHDKLEAYRENVLEISLLSTTEKHDINQYFDQRIF